MLPCPRCDIRLKRRHVEGGVAWSCPRCDGRTATYGLLRKHLEDETLRGIHQRVVAPDAAPGARCPSCLKTMREVTLRTPAGYQELDVCRKCTFVWFDPDEFHALAGGMPEREPSPAMDPIRDPKAVEALARLKLVEHQRAQERERRYPKEGWKWLPGLLGMPVEFDDHEPAAAPTFTYVLVGIVTLVSVLVLLGARPGEVFDAWGFKPSDPWRHGGLTALTSFFLHADWFHLLGNMYFLWAFGDNSEDVLGPRRYLLLLLLATIAGCVLHAWMTVDPTIPAIGASGGISGIIGYYALRFPKMRIGVLFFFVWWLRIPTRIAFALWVAMQLFGAFVTQGNVAYMAHLGGALVGVAFFALDKLVGDAPPAASQREAPQERYGSRAGRYGSRGGRYESRGGARADRYRKP